MMGNHTTHPRGKFGHNLAPKALIGLYPTVQRIKHSCGSWWCVRVTVSVAMTSSNSARHLRGEVASLRGEVASQCQTAGHLLPEAYNTYILPETLGRDDSHRSPRLARGAQHQVLSLFPLHLRDPEPGDSKDNVLLRHHHISLGNL